MLAIEPLSRALGVGEPNQKALRLLGQTISRERRKFADYILRCREDGFIAFDDDPFEIASLFVAMSLGEWSLRLATDMLDKLTDLMIKEHARRVVGVFRGARTGTKAVTARTPSGRLGLRRLKGAGLCG